LVMELTQLRRVSHRVYLVKRKTHVSFIWLPWNRIT